MLFCVWYTRTVTSYNSCSCYVWNLYHLFCLLFSTLAVDSNWHFFLFAGFPSYSFLSTTSTLGNSDRVGTSFYQEYGSVSAANQMVATLMARQVDSQLALGTPTVLTDHYLSQRAGGLHGGSAMSSSAARNMLSLPDHSSDFGSY